jgi:hypothetical protein
VNRRKPIVSQFYGTKNSRLEGYPKGRSPQMLYHGMARPVKRRSVRKRRLKDVDPYKTFEFHRSTFENILEKLSALTWEATVFTTAPQTQTLLVIVKNRENTSLKFTISLSPVLIANAFQYFVQRQK